MPRGLSKERMRKTVINPDPWIPGRTGNPKGRPKGAVTFKEAISPFLYAPAPEALRKIVEKKLGKKLPESTTGIELMGLRRIADSVRSGNVMASETTLDRTEGKVQSSMHVTGVPAPLQFVNNSAAPITDTLNKFTSGEDPRAEVQHDPGVQ